MYYMTRLALLGMTLSFGLTGLLQAAEEKKDDAPATRRARVEYLDRAHAPRGRNWQSMFNGKDLTGWKSRNPDRPMSWRVIDGVYVNRSSEAQRGVDIISEKKYGDFDIYYEYRIPKGSNSGLYLRGRYEIQILDDSSVGAKSTSTNGALYSVRAPDKQVSKAPGEWQSVYARIEGKKVTVFLNGEKIHDNVEMPRPTGGELDNKVDEPGPIMIQGDHGDIEIRHLRIRPLKDGKPDRSAVREAENSEK